MAITDQDIKNEIVNLVSLNPGIHAQNIKNTLADRLHVSYTRVYNLYKKIRDDTNGPLTITTESGLHGGQEAHRVWIKETAFYSELERFQRDLAIHEKQFRSYFPNLRKNKIMITKNKVQLINKNVQNDLDFFVYTLDHYFNQVSALSIMKTNGFIKKEYGLIIENLEKRVLSFIIRSINELLDHASKRTSKTRWNLLIYFRQNLDWLIQFELEKPDLFYKGDWLKTVSRLEKYILNKKYTTKNARVVY